jgi:hypothetical protein
MSRKSEVIRRRRQRRAEGVGPTDRRGMPTNDVSWQQFRYCEVCQRLYCANNNRQHKVQVRKWMGLETCANCEITFIKKLRVLMEAGVIEFTQEFVDNLEIQGGKNIPKKPNRYPKRIRKIWKRKADEAEARRRRRLGY